MNLSTCPHRAMTMGRGTDGGCGAEEKPCPINRTPSRLSSAPTQALDPLHFYAQAQKALSLHSPFDSEEALSRVSTLPVAIAAFVSKCTDRRRRKQKKSLSETGLSESGPRTAASFWAETEEYFRHVTLADVERLVSKPEVNSEFSLPSVQASTGEGSAASAETVAETEAGACGNAVEVGGLELLDAVEEAETGVVRMEVDTVGAAGDLVPKEAGNSAGLHWLLGCRHKTHVTSERPSKKRKLMDGGAGLEMLVVAQPSGAGDSALCDVCCSGESGEKSNGLLLCSSCNVSVHHKCYGVKDSPVERWLCSWCKQPEGLENCSKPCLLCPKDGGALKPVAKDVRRRENGSLVKFAHLFCCMWTPELYVEDTEVMEPIVNVGGIRDARRRLICFLCKMKYGVCVRCSNGTCRTSFHPICAREAKLRMEIWGRFGCNNVELRAFCPKHSSSEEPSNDQHLEDSMPPDDGGDSSVGRLSMKNVPTNRLIKLKLGCKNVDKSAINGETISTNCSEGRKNEVIVEHTPLSPKPNYGDAQLTPHVDTATAVEKDNIEDSDTYYLVQTLYELINQGKINVKDAAAQMGISSDFLSAVLKDEHAATSELQMKMVQWLQDSAHVGTSAHCLKFHTDSAISFADKVAKTDSPNAVKIAGPVGSGAAMPLAPGGRLQSRIRILKAKKLVYSSGNPSVEQNGNWMPVNGINGIPHAIDEHMKENAINDKSDSCCQHFEKPEEKDSLKDSYAHMGVEHGKDQSRIIFQTSNDGGVAGDATNNVSEKQQQPQSIKEKESLDLYEKPCVDIEVTAQTDVARSYEEHLDFAANSVQQCMPVTKKEESASSSYIHPFIKKKLAQMHKCGLFQKKNCILECDGEEKVVLSMKEPWPERPCCSSRLWNATCTDSKCTLNAAGGGQLVKARNLGILDLSPEDELEGEIVYFQSRLLDNAVALKHRFEYLLLRVVSNLPKEMEALCKQRWDEVLVNQFFRQVRETKKQGRKERRHREAQAVLAAATAAAAASSRIPSLRKDTHDEIPSKINTFSGRAGAPRAKETLLRLSVSKNSSEPSEVFQLTSDSSEEHCWSCDICWKRETILNQILVCCNCKVAVHSSCYKGLKDPGGPWYCEVCEEFILKSRSPRSHPINFRESSCFIMQCGICGGTAGAFRKSTDGQWIHAFCAEWVLESTFRRGQADPVGGMEALSEQIDLCVCCICHRKHGICIKCNHDGCQTVFHPTCAKSAGLYMNVKAVECKLHHKAFCGIHSLEQRRKAESQQCGPDELCSIKQIRVELEKLRLLCERIVKREKVKKELVLCSHDILASKRDNVAFSMLVRSSFILPELSSDSVTTSVKGHADKKSCSGTRQRSDNVLVDSTASGTSQVPVHMDIDQKKDGSLICQPSTCKTIGKVPSSGKQLSNGANSIAMQDSTDDGKKRSKTRKHTETFKKELVMTSEQASLRNLRLPKGYVYVPVDDLLKDKPNNRKMEPPKLLDADG